MEESPINNNLKAKPLEIPILNNDDLSPQIEELELECVQTNKHDDDNDDLYLNRNNRLNINKKMWPIISSISQSSSIDSCLDKLAQSYVSTNSKDGDFNAESIPKSFDLFMNDLKKTSSTKNLTLTTTDNHLKTSVYTSSVDKGLEKAASSNENQIDFVTGSPFHRRRNNGKINHSKPQPYQRTSTNSNNVLNRTIDIEAKATSSSNSNSTESLRSSCSSSSSSSFKPPLFPNMAHFGDNEMNNNHNLIQTPPILNTTYTSWSTVNTDLQMQFAETAAIDLNSNSNTSNKTIVFNKTQDFNNNLDHSPNFNSNSNGATNKKVKLKIVFFSFFLKQII
jgi:hypothetical protein